MLGVGSRPGSCRPVLRWQGSRRRAAEASSVCRGHERRCRWCAGLLSLLAESRYCAPKLGREGFVDEQDTARIAEVQGGAAWAFGGHVSSLEIDRLGKHPLLARPGGGIFWRKKSLDRPRPGSTPRNVGGLRGWLRFDPDLGAIGAFRQSARGQTTVCSCIYRPGLIRS